MCHRPAILYTNIFGLQLSQSTCLYCIRGDVEGANQRAKAAIAWSTPPTMAQSAMPKIQSPPWRLRASLLFTEANHLPVVGRLRRQTIKGEKISKMIVVTSGQ